MKSKGKKPGWDLRTESKDGIQKSKVRIGSKDRRQCWIQGQKAKMGSWIERKDGIQSKDRWQGWDPTTECKGSMDRNPGRDPRTEGWDPRIESKD